MRWKAASRRTTLAGTSSQTAIEPIRAAERLLLLIEPDPSSAALIRRGRRVADYLQADCIAVYVAAHADLRDLAHDQRDTLERQLNFARALQIDTRILEGKDAAATLVNFARMNGVTQIFVTRHTDDRLASFFRRGLVQRIVGLAPDMQVTIVADRSSQRPDQVTARVALSLLTRSLNGRSVLHCLSFRAIRGAWGNQRKQLRLPGANRQRRRTLPSPSPSANPAGATEGIMPRPDALVISLRIAAILAVILIVPAMWRLMLWLPWQVDCLLAAAAAFAFAYKFEREQSE